MLLVHLALVVLLQLASHGVIMDSLWSHESGAVDQYQRESRAAEGDKGAGVDISC